MKTWIMKIGVNTCRDMLRSAWLRHRKMSVSPDDLQLAAEENEKDEEAEELGRALLKLPARYKDVILLYYYQDMNLAEVADALQTSTSTVSRRLKHAQDILRNELKGGWEDEREQYPTESSSGSGSNDVLREA
jgi:RNA polymerase sigma-70 factor (ECF subfamily)